MTHEEIYQRRKQLREEFDLGIKLMVVLWFAGSILYMLAMIAALIYFGP